jgi:hypothetical protein
LGVVAALAYILPPLTGLAAYFGASSVRTRFHGLQSIVLGVLWPAALYGGSLITPGATQAAAALGGATWLWFVIGAATGRDPQWPLAGKWLRAAASEPPR